LAKQQELLQPSRCNATSSRDGYLYESCRSCSGNKGQTLGEDLPSLRSPADWQRAIAQTLAEPAWAWLLLGDAAHRPGWDAPAAVQAALQRGRDLARQVRSSFPSVRAADLALALGAHVARSDEPPEVGWRQRRSQYSPRTCEITLYTRSLLALTELAVRFGLGELFTTAALEEAALAHEIYHHLERPPQSAISALHRRAWLRVGPITLALREPAIDEISAHRFAQELCGLVLSPAVLDLLYLHSSPQAAESLIQQAANLPVGGEKPKE